MRYYMHDGPAAFRFELAGELDANDAATLEQDWRTASSTVKNRTLIIDMSFVTWIDEAVRSLFRRWYAEGAEFAASSKQSRELVESITEHPFTKGLPQAPTYQSRFSLKLNAPHDSRAPGRLEFERRGPAVKRRFWIFGLTLASVLNAAELRPETLRAWDRYVQSADAAMQARLRPGSPFLWMDEERDRRQQVRAGEILVASVGEQNPRSVPSGLIHHWIGAAFIPNAKLSEVLGVVRDYAHYKDYYNPTVVDSRTIRWTPEADRFSTLLMNKALFLKFAIENECESFYVQSGSNRWYSNATAVRLQEIDDYGQASERRLPSDEGSGYVWRLHSISRYEEADGGVYIEIEAMALSRDIPAAVRWVVDPMVRRVSKGAMVTSLQQTLGAVSSSGKVAAARSVAIPGLVSGFLQSSSRH